MPPIPLDAVHAAARPGVRMRVSLRERLLRRPLRDLGSWRLTALSERMSRPPLRGYVPHLSDILLKAPKSSRGLNSRADWPANDDADEWEPVIGA